MLVEMVDVVRVSEECDKDMEIIVKVWGINYT